MLPSFVRPFLLVLPLWLAACPKKTVAPAPAAETSAAPEEGAVRPLTLWEVRKGKGEASYLFGTCHMGVSLEEALPQEHRALIEAADLLVMEVDPGTMVQPSVMARLLLPDGQTMSSLMGEEDWVKVLTEFDLLPMRTKFERLHPYVALAQVSSVVIQRSGMAYNRTAGMMDLAISSIAQKGNVEQAWLEDVHDQLDVLLGPTTDYVDGLRKMLDEEEQARSVSDLEAILGLCRTGDVDSALAVLGREESKDFMQALMVERNRNWIPVLEEYMGRGTVFVAAGAGHMVGDDSVVSMLRDAGYTVTRMEGVTAAAPPASDGPQVVTRESFVQLLSDQMPTMLCSDVQPFTRCFEMDASTCAGAFREATATCGETVELPDVIPQDKAQTLGATMGECTVATFMETWQHQLQDSDECAPLKPPTAP